jgi:asparagine synthase (glutamine-hydrolysing)
MSGVYGVVDARRQTDVSALAHKMASVMSHSEWCRSDSLIEEGIAVGRLSIGVFNRELQPVWNSDRSVTLLMAGELYVSDGADLGENPATSEGQRLLDLYAQHGAEFPCHVQGAYVCVVWDAVRRCIVIANDHFGLYLTFYAYHHGRLVFAPEVKGVLLDPDVDRSLRDDAVAEHVRFQHLLGFKTFVAGVHLLPPASVLVYDLASTTFQLQQYWTLRQMPQAPQHPPFDGEVVEATRLFRITFGMMMRQFIDGMPAETDMEDRAR